MPNEGFQEQLKQMEKPLFPANGQFSQFLKDRLQTMQKSESTDFFSQRNPKKQVRVVKS